MNVTTDTLPPKRIFTFWAPLAATWLMMSVEGPFLAAIIARLAEPKYNLAAYGVAFAFALIVEAPIIMIMSASTALVNDNQSFLSLRNYTYFLNTVITVFMLLLLIPDVFYYISMDLMQLPQKVADLVYWATIILLPWPGAIGYRRFYQGILIRFDLTRRVAYGTVIRLTSMACTALVLYFFTDTPGALVGAAALSAGVVMEGIASRIMANPVLKKLATEAAESSNPLNWRGITEFYYPLALTSMLALGVQPIITFFMGQSRMALESLAVLPVVHSLVFIFRSLGLSYQEVAISLMGEKHAGYIPLRNFATKLGLSVAAGMILIAFTPLADLWFTGVSGLTDQLAHFAHTPLQIMAIMPGLTVLLSFQRSVLVHVRKTSPITGATIAEVLGIVIALIVSIKYFDLVGVTAAAIAFIAGRLAANTYLIKSYSNAVQSMRDGKNK